MVIVLNVDDEVAVDLEVDVEFVNGPAIVELPANVVLDRAM